MVSEKHSPSGATAKSDPNFMLMYYMLENLADVGKQVDWTVVKEKMSLPSVAAAQKRWSRLRIAQHAADVSTGEAIPLIKANAHRAPKESRADDKAGEQHIDKKVKVANVKD